MPEEVSKDLEDIEARCGAEFRRSIEQLLAEEKIDEEVIFDWASAIRNYLLETPH